MKDLITKFNEAPTGLKFIYGIAMFMIVAAICFGIYKLFHRIF